MTRCSMSASAMPRRLWVATLEGWWIGTWPESPWISTNAYKFKSKVTCICFFCVKNMGTLLDSIVDPLKKLEHKKCTHTYWISLGNSQEAGIKSCSNTTQIGHIMSQRNTNHLSTITIFSAYQPSKQLGSVFGDKHLVRPTYQLGVRHGCSAWLLMGLKVAQLLQRTQGIQPELGESSLHAFQVRLRYV